MAGSSQPSISTAPCACGTSTAGRSSRRSAGIARRRSRSPGRGTRSCRRTSRATWRSGTSRRRIDARRTVHLKLGGPETGGGPMWIARALPVLVLVLLGTPSHALFHIADIDEVMSGAGGDAGVQYVEIHMLTASQNMVARTRLTYFGCDPGHTASVLLLVPSNVPS